LHLSVVPKNLLDKLLLCCDLFGVVLGWEYQIEVLIEVFWVMGLLDDRLWLRDFKHLDVAFVWRLLVFISIARLLG